MEVEREGTGGGGGVVSSGGSTVTKATEQDYMGLTSEVSSYHLVKSSSKSCMSENENENESDQLELGLGLGLSLGGGGGSRSGTKRAADVSIVREGGGGSGGRLSANGVTSQVVGWPPIKPYRINSLVNRAKVQAVEERDKHVNETGRADNVKIKKTSNVATDIECQEKARVKSTLFVKVNMDGIPIGRKMDLNAHSGYKTLAQTLEDMFHGPTTTGLSIGASRDKDLENEVTKPSKLLDGSSDFVLTYEDKEGDWMLVGDVPWGMFLSTVKRLRVMRTSEANGFAPRFQDSCERQSRKAT